MSRITISTTVDVNAIMLQIKTKSKRAARILTDEGARIFREEVMGTWKTKYPVDTDIVEEAGTGNTIGTIIWGRNPGPRGKVPFWLNFGTSKGFFIVSGEWVSKTAPGRLQSIGGAGDISIVPWPANDGIEARRFDLQVAKTLAGRAPTLLKAVYGT